MLAFFRHFSYLTLQHRTSLLYVYVHFPQLKLSLLGKHLSHHLFFLWQQMVHQSWFLLFVDWLDRRLLKYFFPLSLLF
jgi:hypothetical protein